MTAQTATPLNLGSATNLPILITNYTGSGTSGATVYTNTLGQLWISTYNINVTGAGTIQKLFSMVIQPCIPMEYWAACVEQLAKHAPESGFSEEFDV